MAQRKQPGVLAIAVVVSLATVLSIGIVGLVRHKLPDWGEAIELFGVTAISVGISNVWDRFDAGRRDRVKKVS